MISTKYNFLRKNMAYLIIAILSIGVAVNISQMQNVDAVKINDNSALIPSQSSSEDKIIKPFPKSTTADNSINPINLNTGEDHVKHVGKNKLGSHKGNLLDSFSQSSNTGTNPLNFPQYSYESYLGNSLNYQSFNLPYTAVSPK